MNKKLEERNFSRWQGEAINFWLTDDKVLPPGGMKVAINRAVNGQKIIHLSVGEYAGCGKMGADIILPPEHKYDDFYWPVINSLVYVEQCGSMSGYDVTKLKLNLFADGVDMIYWKHGEYNQSFFRCDIKELERKLK